MNHQEELLKAIREHRNLNDVDLRLIHERGIDAGWPAFRDYVETWAFYHKHHDLIWALLREHAEEQGKAPMAVICAFECAKEIDDGHKFKKAMSSFALSEVARYFVANETLAHLR